MLRPRGIVDPPSLGDLQDEGSFWPLAARHRDVVVTGITHDSRSVQPGDLFAALPGEHAHGASFAEEARAAGAVAILTDPSAAADGEVAGLPALVADDPRAALGLLAARIYGRPGDSLLLLGVTGTNGKSTTVHLLEAGLLASGHVTGIIGTTGVRFAGREFASARTTPEASDLHALLAVMRDEGVTAVAMEVSSHALVLGRVDGLVFDVAVFTQLSQDHLDFHGTMEDYFAAKASLFTSARSRRAIIGVDGMWGRRLADQVEIPAQTYALDHDADVRCESLSDSAAGQRLVIADDSGVRYVLDVGLPGRFNAANALGAWCALRAVGVGADTLETAMAGVKVPGRMESIDAGQGFAAIVDYAHSPDSVARVISAVSPSDGGRRIVVLGCGGDRDRDKRAQMGHVAATGADVLIVTDDNPRSEDPAVIRAAMIEGARGLPADVREIADRRAAIRTAVSEARPGDVVLVLGKGHEQGQESAGVVTAFDDRDELRRALEERG